MIEENNEVKYIGIGIEKNQGVKKRLKKHLGGDETGKKGLDKILKESNTSVYIITKKATKENYVLFRALEVIMILLYEPSLNIEGKNYY